VDDYFFVCKCVCDSIFPACVGALICEAKTISLSHYLWKEEWHMEKEVER
jgi:hypothetical protein